MRNLYYVSSQILSVCSNQVLFGEPFNVSREKNIHTSILDAKHDRSIIFSPKVVMVRRTKDPCPNGCPQPKCVSPPGGLMGNVLLIEKTTRFIVQLGVHRVPIVHQATHLHFSQESRDSP